MFTICLESTGLSRGGGNFMYVRTYVRFSDFARQNLKDGVRVHTSEGFVRVLLRRKDAKSYHTYFGTIFIHTHTHTKEKKTK